VSTNTIAPNKKTVQRLIELKPLARKFAENKREAHEFNLLVAKEYSRGVSLEVLASKLGYSTDVSLRTRLDNNGLYEKAKAKHKVARSKARRNKQTPKPARVAFTADASTLVTMEASFRVADPAKLISAWLSTPYAKETLLQEAEYSINWAQCILDIMTANLDEAALGIEFNSSICGKNPTN
jgi:hypothetical protein